MVRTTDSTHALGIYLNLALRMTLAGIDQLWKADITGEKSARSSAGSRGRSAVGGDARRRQRQSADTAHSS